MDELVAYYGLWSGMNDRFFPGGVMTSPAPEREFTVHFELKLPIGLATLAERLKHDNPKLLKRLVIFGLQRWGMWRPLLLCDHGTPTKLSSAA